MNEKERSLIASPQEDLTFSKLLNHLSYIEAKDVNTKFLFDYFKNYLICSAVLWIGVKAFLIPYPIYLKPFLWVGGIALSLIAIFLCAFNVHYGFEAYSRLKNINSVGNFKMAFIAAILYCLIQTLLIVGK